MYNLLNRKLIKHRWYLNIDFNKNWIYYSILPTELLILFIFKKNDSLFIYIVSRGLKKGFIKSFYLLPLISNTLGFLEKIKFFIKQYNFYIYNHVYIKKIHK